MTRVYVLQHVHSMEEGAEDVKLIGVYSSRENAQAAITRLGRAPGFSGAPDGFHVDEYQIDKDHWVEGYSTLATEGSERASVSARETVEQEAVSLAREVETHFKNNDFDQALDALRKLKAMAEGAASQATAEAR